MTIHHAELTLLSRLDDVESLDKIARSGFDPVVMPTQPLRAIVDWAIRQYHESRCLRAPSRDALMANWKQILEDAEVELFASDEEIDNVEWAIEWLKSSYVNREWRDLIRPAAKEVNEATPDARLGLVQGFVSEFVELSFRVADHTHEIDVGEGMRRIWQSYERRRQGLGGVGMLLDYEALDEHTGGIQPGELAILAAGPKQGKSFQIVRSALKEFELGNNVVINTLENSVEMTTERLVCMATRVDYRRWQRSELTPEETERVERYWEEQITPNRDRLHIIKPAPGEATAAAMVKKAHVLGANRFYIDQLTFMEHPDPRRKPRHEIVRDMLHDLKLMISSGSITIPCLLAHQINREGVKAAKKSDFLEMEMLAESSEAERTADWVFGLFASKMEQIGGMAKLQILAARRETLRNWRITWRPGVRESSIRQEFTLGSS